MSKLFVWITLLLFTVLFLPADFTRTQSTGELTGALLAKLEGHNKRFQAVTFSPDGKLLAAGYGFFDNGGIKIWKVADRSVVVTLLDGASTKAGIRCIAFSEDGKFFAAASDRGDVMLWKVGIWDSYKTLLANRGKTTDLSFSPDSIKLAYSSERAAILYNLQSSKITVIPNRSRLRKSFTGISFSPDSKFVTVHTENQWFKN